jgi:ClpP class serine protease
MPTIRPTRSIFRRLQQEVHQETEVRLPLLRAIQKILGRKLVLFYTSQTHQVMITDDDADMLETSVADLDAKGGLALMLCSLGGFALSAERIVHVLRTYSGDDYVTIVPYMAKSAATMICFGSTKIFMGPTSELGPIDPQVAVEDSLLPSTVVVETYDKLIGQASGSQGNVDPYLQQLSKFHAAVVEHLRDQPRLGRDIAVRALSTGMMQRIKPEKIEQRIKPFLDPEETLAHARPIYATQARECGLTVESAGPKSELWRLVRELHTRANFVVNTQSNSKLLETEADSYLAGLQPGD